MPYVLSAVVTPWVEVTVPFPQKKFHLLDQHPIHKWSTDYTGSDPSSIIPDPNTNTVLVIYDALDWPTVEADPGFAPLWNEEYTTLDEAIERGWALAKENANVP